MMQHTHFRAIWISDLHLCSRNSRAQSLYNFLRTVRCDHFYIVGDFLDLWQLKRRWHWPQVYNDLLRLILTMARQGTQVVLVPGNHDELIGRYAGRQFGSVEVRTEAMHTTADGRKLLILHGDRFDTLVRRRWLTRLGIAGQDYAAIAGFIVRRLTGRRRFSLSARIKHHVKRAASYVSNFERAAVAYARTSGADGVVCGHVHQPAIKGFGDVTYYNAGDWVDRCSALVEGERGRMFLLHYNDWHSPLHPPRPMDDDDVAAAAAEASVLMARLYCRSRTGGLRQRRTASLPAGLGSDFV